MKLNLILVFLLALIALGNAIAGDSSTANSQTQEIDTANSMTWPMLPGESLNDLARLFYPKNKSMQRQFVFKTVRLNADIQTDLNPDKRFEVPVLLLIPTLKSLSKNTHAIQFGAKKNIKQKLQLSYNIEQIVAAVPEKLLQDYEFLRSKNAFLKAELANLNEKLVYLQSKLDGLRLLVDKTLRLSAELTPKKALKNLDKASADKAQTSATGPDSILDNLNTHLVKLALVLGLLAILAAYLFNKYQRRMLSTFSLIAHKVQNPAANSNAFAFTSKAATVQENVPELAQEAQATREAEARLDATLEEAKLLMSINRATDAIAHLKMSIASQPKASINHYLYLLEIFRKLNLKEDFEKLASDLHQTLNVMTPVWYETEIPIVIAQSLEEFPHIVEKLCSIWPNEAASAYLRNLITDNRGGERTGFGKAVLGEILMLIALLDTRRDLT